MSEDTASATSTAPNNVIIGVCLALTASLCNAGGNNLQKYSQKPSVQSNGLNLIGVITSASGGIVEMLSFSFAPQSTLAPLGASVLVFNLLLAPLINSDESIDSSDVVTALAIGIGVVACVVTSLQSEEPLPTFDGAGLRSFLMRSDALVCLGLLFGCLAFSLGQIRSLERRLKPGTSPGMQGAVYPFQSGILASTTNICAKLLGEIGSAGGPSAVGYDVLLIAIIGVTISGIGNMFTMNRGLGRGNSVLLAIPIFSATAVCFNCLSGGLFWGEFGSMAMVQKKAMGFGVACILGGVGLLLNKAKALQETATKEEKAE